MDLNTTNYSGFNLRNPEEIRLTPKRPYSADHLREVSKKPIHFLRCKLWIFDLVDPVYLSIRVP